MGDVETLRTRLTGSLDGPGRGQVVGERLCAACVELLDVDGAALSVMYDGELSRSYAASSSIARELDELQATLGEGPCVEAISTAAPSLRPDLNRPADGRLPGFTSAALQRDVQAVFSLPVYLAAVPVGALDLYRHAPGEMDFTALGGALLAAELAALPLLDLMGLDFDAAMNDESSNAWEQLSALTRVEVFRAAGIVIGQLQVSAAEALVRIRGYAYAHDMTASQVAFEILERRLQLGDDQNRTGPTQERS
jgi:hypothetical protein